MVGKCKQIMVELLVLPNIYHACEAPHILYRGQFLWNEICLPIWRGMEVWNLVNLAKAMSKIWLKAHLKLELRKFAQDEIRLKTKV
jgi:hypothetical protein